MRKDNQNLKLRDGKKIDEIIKIFEKESPKIKVIASFKKYSIVLAITLVIYTIISIFVKKYFNISGITQLLVSIVVIFGVAIITYLRLNESIYMYSKDIGGQKAKYRLKELKNIFQIYNLELIETEEWKLINKILKVNHFNRNKIKELKDYISRIKPNKDVYDIKSHMKKIMDVYMSYIIIPILTIYGIIAKDIEIVPNIINMLDIFSVINYAFIITIVVYIFYKLIKEMSINDYVLNRLEKLLVEKLLNK